MFSNKYVPKIDQTTKLPFLIFPLVALGYSPDQAYSNSEKAGWIPPTDVAGVLTNCAANHLHLYLKNCIYGQESLEDYLSNQIRIGSLSRQKALEILSTEFSSR